MADFDSGSKRRLVIQVDQVVDQIISGYKDKEQRASHWVQKDGIQNCWDARKDPQNKNKNWKCEVELHQDKKMSIVTITDYGTWGLTGKRLEEKDLLKEQAIEERWCRFENYAFNNKNTKQKHLLGSRGRGKFVFSGASESKTTLYETLRDDKVYRLGKRVVEKLDAPNWLEEGKKAKDILTDATKGMLKPLTHVGTRIIIMDPSKELVEDIQDGHMEQFISETWWEIIEKSGAKIVVNNGTTSKTVKPFTQSLPCSAMTQTKVSRPKTSKDQEIFIKESVPITNTNYRIKKLYILYDPNRSFDDRQIGISVQRGGMSICRFPMTELGINLSDHMTGYVLVDEKFQDEMRKTEGPEHYSYNWSSKPTSSLSFVLKKLYKEFATKQLGWKENTSGKSSKSDQKADDRARNKANEIAKRMGFGKGKRTRGPTHCRLPKKKIAKIVGLQLNDLEFPKADTLRINYGEFLKKIGAKVINTSSNDIKVGIKIEIRSIEKDIQVYGKEVFTTNDFSSKKKCETGYCSNISLKIDKKDYSPGKYHVKSTLALITPFGKFTKGQILDVSERAFWVETDPPESGIWEGFEAADFSLMQDEYKTRRSYVKDGTREGSYILVYSISHAAHKALKSTDEKAVAQYRYCLTVPELCVLDIEEDDPEQFTLFTESDRKQGMGHIAKMINDTVDKYTDSKYLDDV